MLILTSQAHCVLCLCAASTSHTFIIKSSGSDQIRSEDSSVRLDERNKDGTAEKHLVFESQPEAWKEGRKEVVGFEGRKRSNLKEGKDKGNKKSEVNE